MSRKNIRLVGYDYSRQGPYYITICVKDRKCVLSRIENGKVILTEIGQQAENDWKNIPSHRPNALVLDYVIMPNHIHGIIWIKEGATVDQHLNQFSQPIAGSLSMIIGGYKAGITRWCRKNGYEDFAWQLRFYDSIIWQESELWRVQDYIENNPERWTDDDIYEP